MQFRRAVREFKPDVVHVHYPLIQALPCVGAHSLPHDWRLVVTAHGSDIRRSPFETPRIRSWQARLFDHSDAVTAVSRSLLGDLVALYPRAAQKGRVVYNGVSSHWFQQHASATVIEEKYVLFVGRLHRVKGVDILLRAWKQICAAFPAVRLWLVGEGPERESLQALAEQLGIASRVKFAGPMPKEWLPAAYRDAEVVVLPSRSEGMPLTLLEAGASGGLFVGTCIPGIPEIIEEGVTGFLATAESPDALASAITRALQAPREASRRIRDTLLNTIRQRFSEDVVVSDYFNLFKGLLSEPPTG
jgi:glycosyltransferase involved in cell wall biosynthesis